MPAPVGNTAVLQVALLAAAMHTCQLRGTTTAAAATSTSATLQPKVPNVLILFVDDWGWGDLGANCFTMSEVPGARPDRLDKETACDSKTNRTLTPQLDALAVAGMRFTDHHATGVCTPSRCQLQVHCSKIYFYQNP